MKIVGILSAYDESATWLTTAVTGFAKVCDAIVYADGSYGLYPSARPRSHPEQAEGIMLTCEAADVECLIHRPKEPYWGNEVEKRNKSLQLAGSLDPDWVLVFDADYHVIRCDSDRVRHDLENTEHNVATYTLLDSIDYHKPGVAGAEMASLIDLSTEYTSRTRDIYRWTPDLRYGPAHFTIRGTYNGEVKWVRGPELVQSGVPAEPACLLEAGLVAVHRTKDRVKVRKDAQAEYYARRDAASLEWLDGDDWAAKLNEQEALDAAAA